MFTQNIYLASQVSGHCFSTVERDQQERKLVLNREHLAICPLGTIGNLRFTAGQGGTARVGRVRAFLSELGYLLASLAFHLTFPSNEARARRDCLEMARQTSYNLGNLLGALTGEKDDAATLYSIAVELESLAVNNLYSLCGRRYFLSTYVAELKDKDIKALREGVLDSQPHCKMILGLFSSDNYLLHKLASEVLDDIEGALSWREAMDSVKDSAKEAFMDIVKAMSPNKMDSPVLKRALKQLADAMEAVMKVNPGFDEKLCLNMFLKHLPKDQLQSLMPLAHDQVRDRFKLALLPELGRLKSSEYACYILNLVHQSLAAL